MTVAGAGAEELEVIRDADARALAYLRGIGTRRVFPDGAALAGLDRFREPLPDAGRDARDTIRLLDEAGTPAAVESNGARYFGFVVGAALPVAAAADRLALAWDNGGVAAVTSPAAAAIERVAGEWLLEVLDLPREAAVGFTTSASAGTVVALAAARRELLRRLGWDLDAKGLTGAPRITAAVSELAHVAVLKALRVLGFGTEEIVRLPVDDLGRVRPESVPDLDARTLLVLQAGEVNTGESDPFARIVPVAKRAGAWVHVDGAFGLWARATRHRALTDGIELADSWTVDGHKWLNTPYDSAMVIVRDRDALAQAMSSDAAYSPSSPDAQKNLVLEFSRRARGIPVWAALRTLGREGVAELVEGTIDLAAVVADGLRAAGFEVLNRPVLNQVLAAADTPERTARVVAGAQASGRTWFGGTTWRGRPAFRISVSSWRTERRHVDDLVALLAELAER